MDSWTSVFSAIHKALVLFSVVYTGMLKQFETLVFQTDFSVGMYFLMALQCILMGTQL